MLVIDDDPSLRAAYARILSADYELSVAEDAIEALECLIAGERFDAIVCDVMMPRLSGPDFHRRVTHLDHDAASRIVFVTGGGSEAVQRALAALPNRVLCKPIGAQELRDAVRQIVER